MYKKFLTTLFILIICATASAEIKIFTGAGEHYIESETETLAQAQDAAKLAAELDAMQQTQIFIISYSEAHNSALTQDEIITITAGVMNVTDVKYSLKDEAGVLLMRAEVTAEIDTDKIPALIERELKNRGLK